MSNEGEFLIGEWNPEKNRKFEKRDRFDIKEGVDNVYRVLPPTHSLAQAGQYSKYWKIHWCFNGTKKKPDGSFVKYPIVCSEEIDYKTKEIKTHCPICDLMHENTREMEFLRRSGKLTEDQLKIINKTKIMPYQPDGRYYVNAVDINGKIGTLGLKKTARDALEDQLNRLKETENIKAIGTNGIYFNFIRRKNSSGKTVYEAVPFMVPDEQNPKAKVYKEHVIDKAFFEKMRTGTVDLTTLFTRIPDSTLAAIVAAPESERPQLVDKAFNASQKKDNVVEQNRVTIPESGGTIGVADVYVDNNLNVKVSMPDAPKPGFTASTSPSQVSASGSIPDLEDDEAFRALMEERFGK